MTDRKFEPVSAPDPTDVYHRVRIRCSHKDCKTSMIFSRRGPIEPVHAAKWFRDKGWGVGSNTKQDLCPEHNGRGFISDIAKRSDAGTDIKMVHSDIRTGPLIENPLPVEVEIPPKILQQIFETPSEPVLQKDAAKIPLPNLTDPQMTRTDKRIIYAKLDEVYADEKTGYRGNWSDERVAQDLGVPVDWVAQCRDETFGPEVNRQAEINKLVAEAERHVALFRAAMDALMHDVKVTIDQYENKIKELKDE